MTAAEHVGAVPFPGTVTNLEPVPQRFQDFIYFSQRQYDCLDYDPFHPMLYHMQKRLGVEEALWMSTLFMAWYNIGSFYIAFRNCDVLKLPPGWTASLPIGTQRRNLRGGKVLDHLKDFIKQAQKAGSIHKLLTKGFGNNPTENWRKLNATVDSIWGNGRWSTYTTCEVYQKVNKLDVLPSDIMNEGSTGPRTGLCFMHGVQPPSGTKVVPLLDQLAQRFHEQAQAHIKTRIPYLPEGWYDLGMVESQLCDFNSLRKGRYYIGRDIDRDQDRLRATEKTMNAMQRNVCLLNDVWVARAVVFPKSYLGEYQGWPGRTEYAKTYYLRTGKVASHAEIKKALGYLF